MIVNQREKCHIVIFFTIILSGVFAFGVASLISKVTSKDKQNSSVFGCVVATVMDNFKDKNMKVGQYVVVKETGAKNFSIGDYVIYNDFIGATLRINNCGKVQSFDLNGEYIYVESEASDTLLKIPTNMCFGKVDSFSQLRCGWVRFISSNWSNFLFILVPFVFAWGVLEAIRYVTQDK